MVMIFTSSVFYAVVKIGQILLDEQENKQNIFKNI